MFTYTEKKENMYTCYIKICAYMIGCRASLHGLCVDDDQRSKSPVCIFIYMHIYIYICVYIYIYIYIYIYLYMCVCVCVHV